jgi:hypothetical protein
VSGSPAEQLDSVIARYGGFYAAAAEWIEVGAAQDEIAVFADSAWNNGLNLYRVAALDHSMKRPMPPEAHRIIREVYESYVLFAGVERLAHFLSLPLSTCATGDSLRPLVTDAAAWFHASGAALADTRRVPNSLIRGADGAGDPGSALYHGLERPRLAAERDAADDRSPNRPLGEVAPRRLRDGLATYTQAYPSGGMWSGRRAIGRRDIPGLIALARILDHDPETPGPAWITSDLLRRVAYPLMDLASASSEEDLTKMRPPKPAVLLEEVARASVAGPLVLADTDEARVDPALDAFRDAWRFYWRKRAEQSEGSFVATPHALSIGRGMMRLYAAELFQAHGPDTPFFVLGEELVLLSDGGLVGVDSILMGPLEWEALLHRSGLLDVLASRGRRLEPSAADIRGVAELPISNVEVLDQVIEVARNGLQRILRWYLPLLDDVTSDSEIRRSAVLGFDYVPFALPQLVLVKHMDRMLHATDGQSAPLLAAVTMGHAMLHCFLLVPRDDDRWSLDDLPLVTLDEITEAANATDSIIVLPDDA